MTISNRGQLVLPATLELTYKDERRSASRFPWESKGTAVISAEKPVASAVIDPDHQLPEDNRANNMK